MNETFEMRRCFDEAVAYGLFDNIDAHIATCEALAQHAIHDENRQKWQMKAQEWRQLRADAELQRETNKVRDNRESGNDTK